jgi:hypothetical protein
MNIPFGVHHKPSSLAWEDVRKGPSLEAVREHLDRVINFGRRTSLGPARAQR